MFPSPTTGGWTSVLRAAHPAPAARIVVFPHAGGDAALSDATVTAAR